MDLGCALNTDGLASVSSEPNVLIPSSFFPLVSEPSKQRELLQSSLATSKAATCLLRSGSHSLLSDGEQMLNFSSGKPDALVLNNHWNLPLFNHLSSSSCSSVYPTSLMVLSSKLGVLDGLDAPFSSLRASNSSAVKRIYVVYSTLVVAAIFNLIFDLLAR